MNSLRASKNQMLVDDDFAQAGLTTDKQILARFAGSLVQESKSTSSEPIDSSQRSHLSLSRSKDFTYGTLSTLKTKPEIVVSANFPNQMINLSNS